PEETGPIESGLTAHRIQKQISGYPRKVVPPDCMVVVQGIDVGKVLLHWVVRAFRADATGYTIDRDVTPVHGTVVNSDEGLDVAIMRAIKQRMAEIEQDPYRTADGQVVPIALTLIDAGYRTSTAIYPVCRELGLGVMPAMGFGKSAGCAHANFSMDQKPREGRIVGDGWRLDEIDKLHWPGLWRVNMDTDRWKAWEHDRWMTDPAKPGCMFLFGEAADDPKRLSQDEKDHMSYAKQIVAEVEIEEVHKGVLRRRWHSKSDKNHWLDASYMADVAASIKGVRLLRSAPAPPASAPAPRPLDENIDPPFLASAR
ncbi:MAG: phage terminase large subunit family protein, partial [Rhodospirillales bacterium]|nr:phage terminase large subunit family protein [Rhodospirillales bacterium]